MKEDELNVPKLCDMNEEVELRWPNFYNTKTRGEFTTLFKKKR